MDNDSDPEAGQLTLISVESQLVIFDASGTATFSTPTDFIDSTTITYQVKDDAGNVSLGQWKISAAEAIQVRTITTGGAIFYSTLYLCLVLMMRFGYIVLTNRRHQ